MTRGSTDTGEPFGVGGCDWVEENGGRMIGPEGPELSEGQITDWSLDSCRNLEPGGLTTSVHNKPRAHLVLLRLGPQAAASKVHTRI